MSAKHFWIVLTLSASLIAVFVLLFLQDEALAALSLACGANFGMAAHGEEHKEAKKRAVSSNKSDREVNTK